MLQTLIKKLLATVVTVVAMLGAGSAHAIVYNGSWDPAYGTAFPDLGWKGDITFTVDASCLLTASSFNPCTTAQAHIDSVVVKFYDLSAPATTIESFPFGSFSAQINGVYLDAGKHVVGIQTELFLPFTPTATLDGVNAYKFYLSFDVSGAQLINVPKTQNIGYCFGVHAAECGFSAPKNDINGPGVFLHITTVPEPGTYALFSAGALGLWIARRRRQQR